MIEDDLAFQAAVLLKRTFAAGVSAERERCASEVRRIQKRNTNTSSIEADMRTWNSAVKTMADECADAITSP